LSKYFTLQVHKADISQSEEDYSLSYGKQAVEPSTSENVLSTATQNKLFAEEIVENSDEIVSTRFVLLCIIIQK
jgi:hypothetical protein